MPSEPAITKGSESWNPVSVKGNGNEPQTCIQLCTSRELAQELQQKVEDLENEKANIKRQRDFALGELRKRPTREQAKERASSNPTSAPKTCTGAELPREDAEFLTGEAANAELIAKERDFYYERYEQSRLRLEALERELN